MSRCAVAGSAMCGRVRIVRLDTSIASSWIAALAVVLAWAPGGPPPSKRMADGKVWTTRNADVDV